MAHLKVLVIEPVTAAATSDQIAAAFEANPSWHAVAFVDDERRPVALLGRQQFMDRHAKPYFKEVYGRKPCLTFANTTPTLIDIVLDIDALVAVLTSADQRYLNEGFICTDNGCFHGLGTGHQHVCAGARQRPTRITSLGANPLPAQATQCPHLNSASRRRCRHCPRGMVKTGR